MTDYKHFECPKCGTEQPKLRTIFECFWPKRDWSGSIGGESIRAVLDCIFPGCLYPEKDKP